MVLRAEAVYANGQGYSVTESRGSAGRRAALDARLHRQRRVPAAGRHAPQHPGIPARLLRRRRRATSSIKSDGFGASIFLSTKLTDAFEPQILWIQNFKDAGGLVRPRLNWYPAKNTAVGFGVDIFTGPSDGYFGRYNNRDRVYAELRYDF